MATDLQRQGIGENDYPQYGTNFWGNSANNYGFGIRNIGQNAQNHPALAKLIFLSSLWFLAVFLEMI